MVFKENEFKQYMIIDRSVSIKTFHQYIKIINTFINYLNKNNKIAINATSNDIQNFFYNYSSCSKNTIKIYLIAIRNYYLFLLENKYITLNPCDIIDLPKINKYHPSFLTEQEITDLLESIDINKPLGKRDYSIINLLYATGMRVSELINLKIQQIDFYNYKIRCFGKGSKERIVFFSKNTFEALNLYINNERNALKINPKNDILYLSRNGNKLSREDVYLMVTKRAKAANIGKNVSPHTLRHTFATHLVNHNADLRSVQKILGHSDISTTQIYMHNSYEDIKNKYLKLKGDKKYEI